MLICTFAMFPRCFTPRADLSSRVLLLFWCVFQCGHLGDRASAELLRKPRNTVAVLGGRVKLECATNVASGIVQWLFANVATELKPSIYVGGQVNPTYSQRNVSVIDSNLVFQSVMLDDAGLYTCQESGVAGGHSSAAWINVLVEEPHCWNETESLTDSLYLTRITCNTTFNGVSAPTDQLVPVANWTNCGPTLNKTSSMSVSISGSAYYRSFIATAEVLSSDSSEARCTYRLSFTAVTSNPYIDSGSPNYSFVWPLRQEARPSLPSRSENLTSSLHRWLALLSLSLLSLLY